MVHRHQSRDLCCAGLCKLANNRELSTDKPQVNIRFAEQAESVYPLTVLLVSAGKPDAAGHA